jgi:hypothetical protein
MNNQLTVGDHFNRQQLVALSQKCDTNANTLKIILSAQNSRIIDLIKIDETKTRSALQNLIFGLAEIYTTAQLRDADGITEAARLVLSECINLTINKFNLLSAEEIKEAFRQAAAGEIDANLTAYYGKFTPVMFGDVLLAYKRKRNKIRAKFDASLALIESRQPAVDVEGKNKSATEKVINAFFDLKKQINAGNEINADDVPAFWALILIKSGVITLDSTIKAEIYAEAKKEALKRLKLAASEQKLTSYQRKEAKTLLIKVLKNIENGSADGLLEFSSTVKSLYSKLLIIHAIKN